MSKKEQKPTQAKSLVTDDRFKHVHSDPRFKRAMKKAPKAKVDKRFQAVFKDKDFASNVAIDKYGRKVEVKKSGLNEMYDQDDEEEEEEEEIAPKKTLKKQVKGAKASKEPVVEVKEEDSEEEEAAEDSDSTDIGSTDDEQFDGADSDEEELNDGYIPGSIANTAAPIVEKPTRRLAMMNMEWEQLRAVDLLAVMRSFCPAAGQVHSVSIYPSEFGKQRMAEESKFGPVALFEASKADKKKKVEVEEEGEELVFEEIEDEDEDGDEDVEEDDEDADVAAAMRNDAAEDDIEVDEDVEADEDEEDLVDESDIGMDDMVESDDENNDGVDMDKLREYELSKLRYFYAIVDCDSAETALHIYKEADGLEYETSANVFDLRFVPDEQVFDEATLRDKAVKVPANHRPPVYQTNALQQTKVKCTWDREDPARAKLLRRQFEPGTYKADDLSVFMADESDEEGYGTDVPVSESDESDSEEEDEEDSRVVRSDDGKKTVLLKRRARSAFASILSEIKGGDSKEEKKKREMKKRLAKANKTHNGDEDAEDEDDESEDSSDSDSDDQEIVFQPALHTFADRVANKAKEKEADAVQARMTVWEKHLAKLKDKKKAKKTEAKVKAKQEAIEKGKVEKGSIYSDDEVDYDKSDPFFQNVFDEEEFGADAKEQKGKKGKKVVSEDDDDDEEEVEMVPEVKKKMKSKKQAELELLMMKDQREEEEEKRGYSLSTLVKENKLKHKAESKKRKTRANEEDALIDSMLGKNTKEEITAEDMIRTAKKKYGQKKKVEETVSAMASDSFKMDVADNRFSALHADPAFAIDPTSQLFKATAGTEALLEETQRKRRDMVREQEKQIRERKAKLRTVAAKEEKVEKKDEKEELQSLVAKLKTANTVHNMQERVKIANAVPAQDMKAKGKGKNKK